MNIWTKQFVKPTKHAENKETETAARSYLNVFALICIYEELYKGLTFLKTLRANTSRTDN